MTAVLDWKKYLFWNYRSHLSLTLSSKEINTVPDIMHATRFQLALTSSSFSGHIEVLHSLVPVFPRFLYKIFFFFFKFCHIENYFQIHLVAFWQLLWKNKRWLISSSIDSITSTSTCFQTAVLCFLYASNYSSCTFGRVRFFFPPSWELPCSP